MKLLLSVLFVTLLAPAQAFAFGWFLFGLAVGSSGNKKTTYEAPATNLMYLEVQDCDDKAKALINSGIITGLIEGYRRNKNITYVATARGYQGYCIFEKFDKVQKKLFQEKKQEPDYMQ